MKYIGVIFALLLLLAAGCTPASPGQEPASPSVPEVALSPSPEPVPSSPTVITPPAATEQSPVPALSPETTPAPVPEPESKEPATQFVWTVDSGIRLEDATVPNILRLEDGRFLRKEVVKAGFHTLCALPLLFQKKLVGVVLVAALSANVLEG